MKKFLMVMLAAAMVSFGFMSCANDDDDDNTPSAAEKIAGTYTGNATFTVMNQTVNFEDVSFVVTKLTDTTVSVKVPSITYSAAMTFPEYTLTDSGAVTGAEGIYSIAFVDTTTEADSNGKTTTVSGITAVVENDVLTFVATEKYGSMPMAGVFAFTSTSKE